jgi:ribosomal protein S18 acetylase RimI-like enzyme
VDKRSSGLRIRRFQESDHDAVWALHNDALHDAGAHAGSGPWDEDLHAIPRVYLERGGEFIVGLLDGELVAIGALRRTSARRAEIKRMRVAPPVQGRGYGRCVLEHLESRAAELGYTQLHLDTTAEQRAAQALYRRHGYCETGREQRDRFELIFYEKDLAGVGADR